MNEYPKNGNGAEYAAKEGRVMDKKDETRGALTLYRRKGHAYPSARNSGVEGKSQCIYCGLAFYAVDQSGHCAQGLEVQREEQALWDKVVLAVIANGNGAEYAARMADEVLVERAKRIAVRQC